MRHAFPLVPPDLRAWASAAEALRTGAASFPAANGAPYWDYMRRDIAASERVDRSVESANRVVSRMLDRIYDWDSAERVVDVGGGNGSFLAALLAKHPRMTGVVVDLPHVMSGAPAVLAAAGVADRCEVVAGDFFRELPADGDAYVVKTILHDWDDGRAIDILRSVRRAMPSHGRVIVIEALLPPGDAFDVGKLLDLNSFVLSGGVDRCVEEYAVLFEAAGLRLSRVVHTTNALALIEAVPDSSSHPPTNASSERHDPVRAFASVRGAVAAPR
jgi:SAM-dependent methyltransferase